MNYAINMLRAIGVAALTALFMASMPSAHATVQTYSFGGSLNSMEFTGSFSFDDALLSVFDSSSPLVTVAPVTNLSMNYNDMNYSLADAWGASDVSYYDGAFLGLSYSNDAMTFVAGTFDTSDAFVTDGINSADVIYAAVPEPQSHAMVLAGLGLLGFAMRRWVK